MYYFLFFQKIEENIEINLIEELVPLLILILKFRDFFSINHEVMTRCYLFVIKHPNKKTFSQFIDVLRDKEFATFANNLCIITVK